MATRALGTTISKGATLIGGLTEINGVEKTAETIDVTTLDSSNGYREFVASFKDGGEVSVSGFFIPGNGGQVALETAFESGVSDVYTITFPASMAASWLFNGVVTKIMTAAQIGEVIPFEATIKISGKPVLGVTASTGISALSFSGSGTLSPTVGAGTFNYTYTFTTATSITATVTASSHTILLYVDGVLAETLTSAVASSNITGFTAQSSKKIDIVVYEANKTPKTYTVIASRTT
jgi:predicted secreted protein